MKLAPDGWRWPRLITHIFDHPSTTVTFAFWAFFVATYFIRLVGGENWMIVFFVCALLLGGVRFGKDLLSFAAIRFGVKLPPDQEKKEDKPNATPPQP